MLLPGMLLTVVSIHLILQLLELVHLAILEHSLVAVYRVRSRVLLPACEASNKQSISVTVSTVGMTYIGRGPIQLYPTYILVR